MEVKRPEVDTVALKDGIRRYQAVISQIKKLEAEKQRLNGLFLEMMEATSSYKLKTSVGTFSRKNRQTWRYSDDVEMIKEELEFAKKDERETGKATVVDNWHIAFTPKKETK